MKHFSHRLKNAAIVAVDSVLPPRCPVSGEIVGGQGALSPLAWQALDFIADPVCACCGLPFAFTVDVGTLCADCLDDPPAFDVARAALRYNDASRALILGFKHGDKTHAVVSFVPWLRQAGAEMLAEADLIVPVPLHPLRMFFRRYNQAALMAAAIGRDTKILTQMNLLRRLRHTPSQGHKRAKDRARNVKGAFDVRPECIPAIKGKRIIIVDDVFTTGSTVKECARVLRRAGAAHIGVLVLARALKE